MTSGTGDLGERRPRQGRGLGRQARADRDRQAAGGRARSRSGRLGLAGDEQADKPDHGGPEQAVYAYAREDLDWWVERLGRELPNGMFGENITTAGWTSPAR